jgi:4a-hydroxytetrahydrobiopterin dehydratase
MKSLSTCGCRADTKKLTPGEIEKYLSEVEGWEVITESGIQKLKRKFITRIFKRSMLFTNKVADLAEEVDHHPQIIVEFSSVTILWWSHTVEGLHKNDFILAGRSSELFETVLNIRF